ncbi:MAG: efflux RND transporter periplasmic adaptor subunit, partial [Thermodesulfobacteriota bacterium]
GGVFSFRYYAGLKIEEAMSERKPEPVSVAAEEASTDTWQPVLTAVGSFYAVNGVQVTGEVAGLVTDIRFESGQEIARDEPLVQLDTRADRDTLDSLLAARELARIQLERMQTLVKRSMAPQSDLDEARAKYKQARAEAARQQTIIEKKTIKAPFSGVLGIREVNLGQYLDPGTALVKLQSLDPIYVRFSLPQQNLKAVRLQQEIEVRVDTWPDRVFRGSITAIEPSVGERTRNFRIQATLDNPDRLLKPGLFGRVAVQLPSRKEVVTLPQTAIDYNPYGDVIFVLQESGEEVEGRPVFTASRRFVTTGERRGDQVAIVKGIEPGDLVVIVGQHKLREGARAQINNEVKPDNLQNPEMTDT